jgi:hypothetical protein
VALAAATVAHRGGGVVLSALAVGIATVVLPNPWFTGMTGVTGWSWLG